MPEAGARERILRVPGEYSEGQILRSTWVTSWDSQLRASTSTRRSNRAARSWARWLPLFLRRGETDDR